MNVTLVTVLFVAAALIAIGAFVTAWKHDIVAALAGLPVMFAGAGAAFVGVSRFAATDSAALVGQEVAVLLALLALSSTALGIAIAGREAAR